MSFEKFKSDSYCVGDRHRSATTKIYSDITSKSSNVLIGYCSVCNKKSLTVPDNKIQAEAFVDFFKNLGKKDLMYQKNGKKSFKKPRASSGIWSKRWNHFCISKSQRSTIIITRGD